MSTKIYNAYKVKSFEEAFAIKDELYKIYREYAVTKLLEWRNIPIGEVFYEQQEVFKNSKKYKVSYHYKLKDKFRTLMPFEIQKLYRKKDVIGHRGDLYDLSVSIVLFYDAPTKSIVMQFFGVDNVFFARDGNIIFPLKECFQKFIKEKRLIDVHYQDQSRCEDDEYEDSADEENRKSMWERILDISGVPSAAGFSYDFLNDNVLWEYYNKNVKLMKKEAKEKELK